MVTEKVFDCPRCNIEPEIISRVADGWHRPNQWKVVCKQCGFGEGFQWNDGEDADTAIHNWNIKAKFESQLLKPFGSYVRCMHEGEPLDVIIEMISILKKFQVESTYEDADYFGALRGNWSLFSVKYCRNKEKYRVDYKIRRHPDFKGVEWFGDYSVTYLVGKHYDHDILYCSGMWDVSEHGLIYKGTNELPKGYDFKMWVSGWFNARRFS